MNANGTVNRQCRPGLWGGLSLATLAAVVGLKMTGAINPSTAYVLLCVPIALGFLSIRAMQRAAPGDSCQSPATMRYTKGIAVTSLAYILGLGIAITIHRNYEIDTALTFLLALMPVVPIFGMIWVMARYLREETDEYLRHRAVMAALGGLAAVLGIGSFWGFLETFELVPHAEGWWSVPIWALGMGLTMAWLRRADKGAEE